ncbi:anthocyanidin 3-O-glucosyltransferase 2-like [Punica granatum]|uniref:Anthocyanidin 3-O-glucosyltransferase 2-like n=1 Tax=Punica granatum TaxID=22663 RepID=A0A6P8CYU8_PUNGR|nr:anthocyanidin 3-O-glucosyltransferase 2-like [Punica granatum]
MDSEGDKASSVDGQSEHALEVIPGLAAIRFVDLPEELLSPEPIIFDNLRKLLPRADAVVFNSYAEVNPAPLISDLRSNFRKLLNVGCTSVKIPTAVHVPSRLDQTECLELLDYQQKPEFCGEDVLLWENCSLVPQSQILSHPSTRAFISHWGYSLVFESVIGEVPIICIPQWIDQFTDSRMVEDVWGIGVRVEVRTISKNGMVKCLKMILGDGGGGKKMREKIKAIKEAIMEPVGPNGGASKDFKRAWRS